MCSVGIVYPLSGLWVAKHCLSLYAVLPLKTEKKKNFIKLVLCMLDGAIKRDERATHFKYINVSINSLKSFIASNIYLMHA